MPDTAEQPVSLGAGKDAFAKQAVMLGDDPRITAILREICDLTHMGFAALARVTDDRWIACQLVDRIEFGLLPGDELEIKTTICDDIRTCGEAIIIDSVSGDPSWRTHPTPMLYGFESYASLPVYLKDGSFFGTLCAIDPAPHDLSGAEVMDALRASAVRLSAILSA